MESVITFTIVDFVIKTAIFVLTLLGFIFGLYKYVSLGNRERLEAIENRLGKIENDFAKKEDLSKSFKVLEKLLENLGSEQKRISDRMDNFTRWIMERSGKT